MTISQPTVTIPTELFPELEAWGKATAELFGKLRSLAGLEPKTSLPTIPVLKRPKHVPKDQEWFWSEQWQKGEREVNEDIRQGRVSRAFDTAEELIADLNRHL